MMDCNLEERSLSSSSIWSIFLSRSGTWHEQVTSFYEPGMRWLYCEKCETSREKSHLLHVQSLYWSRGSLSEHKLRLNIYLS